MRGMIATVVMLLVGVFAAVILFASAGSIEEKLESSEYNIIWCRMACIMSQTQISKSEGGDVISPKAPENKTVGITLVEKMGLDPERYCGSEKDLIKDSKENVKLKVGEYIYNTCDIGRGCNVEELVVIKNMSFEIDGVGTHIDPEAAYNSYRDKFVVTAVPCEIEVYGQNLDGDISRLAFYCFKYYTDGTDEFVRIYNADDCQ